MDSGQDTFKHKGLRKKLVDEIREKGIRDEDVLRAIGNVPRHLFLEGAFTRQAYEDQAFPIGEGQTISQPYTVAFQTSLLNLKKGEKVLEVGTGSGYQSSVLAEMGAKVFSIERQKNLFEKTRDFLPALGYNVKCFYGDGYKGLPAYAPFDKILVTAGAPFIPQALVDQLKPGGVMVIPVGENLQVMKRLVKDSEGNITEENHGGFRFVPLLENKSH